jgi:hypothetical protein
LALVYAPTVIERGHKPPKKARAARSMRRKKRVQVLPDLPIIGASLFVRIVSSSVAAISLQT